jgi:hypothetical protein
VRVTCLPLLTSGVIVTNPLADRVLRAVLGPPVYLVNTTTASGFAYYGPERIARVIKRFSDGRHATAPHEGGTCDMRNACEDCERMYRRARVV